MLSVYFSFLSKGSVLISCLLASIIFAQHDRERNAFRFLAENKVEKAYFELKNGKKHTDPAEKAFISTLCLLRENKNDQALEMAKNVPGSFSSSKSRAAAAKSELMVIRVLLLKGPVTSSGGLSRPLTFHNSCRSVIAPRGSPDHSGR